MPIWLCRENDKKETIGLTIHSLISGIMSGVIGGCLTGMIAWLSYASQYEGGLAADVFVKNTGEVRIFG